ncbi:MAG: DUF4382 domain-containing protein, partial [Spirulinaceae cyanobacterium]
TTLSLMLSKLMKSIFQKTNLVCLATTLLVSCAAQNQIKQETANESSQTPGTLALVANGEDFVRNGFVTKDNWQIDFDKVYVTLTDVKAYQTSSPFEPESDNEIEAEEEVTLIAAPETVDLAAGASDADPILVTEKEVPPGTYNALAWKLAKAESGEAEGNTIVLAGQAKKENQTVDFQIKLNPQANYTCGEFVGEDRKGIVQSEQQAEVETTFHFDHIFGDAEAEADEEINQGAIGFEPLAALAENGKLNVDQTTLKSQLSDQDYQTLEKALIGLGHVGEGHCLYESGNKE